MTTQPTQFSPKDPAETVSVSFDFEALLSTGETLSTAVFTVTHSSGTPDGNPSAMLDGSSTITGSVASRRLKNGVAGAVYCVECTVTTSASQKLVECAKLGVRACC